jgi:hypothetical protein
MGNFFRNIHSQGIVVTKRYSHLMGIYPSQSPEEYVHAVQKLIARSSLSVLGPRNADLIHTRP